MLASNPLPKLHPIKRDLTARIQDEATNTGDAVGDFTPSKSELAMDIIFVLLPFTLLLALVALVAFVWSVRAGQYNDLHTPALRILFDEPRNKSNSDRAPSDSSAIESASSIESDCSALENSKTE